MIYIAMATYNGEKFIKQQLDSILNQTYKDWYLYVSDDCSTDNTLTILKEYQSLYPEKIKVISNDIPSKSAENNFFNLILSLDKNCDYVALCDQDDVWLENKLELTFYKMCELENKYGKEKPILVHTDLKVVDENLNVLSNSFFEFQNISPERTLLRNLLIQNNITGCTTMINNSLLNLINSKPKECTMHDWWIGLIACCFGYIGYIKTPTMLYRQHSNNQVGAKDAKSVEFISHKLKNRAIVKENYRKMFVQANLFLDEFKNNLSDEQKEVLNAYLKIPKLNRFGKIRQIIKYKFYKNSFMRTFGQFFTI